MFIDAILEVSIGVLLCLIVLFVYSVVSHNKYMKKLDEEYDKNSEIINNISNKGKDNEKHIS